MVEKVTIATVAEHARVSRQTVSNVLNTPHLVREETQARVREAITALGYRANQAARQMRTGRSRLLAVRIEPTRDGINGTVLDRFLHGLTEAAAPAGYRVLLYAAADDTAEIATYDDLLAAYDLDAFVLTSTHHGDVRTSWLAERGVPFVTFGQPWGRPPAIRGWTWTTRPAPPPRPAACATPGTSGSASSDGRPGRASVTPGAPAGPPPPGRPARSWIAPRWTVWPRVRRPPATCSASRSRRPPWSARATPWPWAPSPPYATPA
ncbi:hypothetical protein Prum_025750 [Phytohabitans rumicis]|uniref:HTH lacI-type domain-containing protein n=1 Tax=Phytohabitans rumicis TaxID=1076125 RepID=A0A6V8KV32_9ACTN|nr:hypothetical protein Prum_025750 [Phytohabitans rumicis]